MSFEKRLRAGLESITSEKHWKPLEKVGHAPRFRVFDTANRVSGMLKRGLNTHTGNRPEKTPRQFISGAIRGNRVLPGDGASIDGSCATILLAGMAAFTEKEGDLLEEFHERLHWAHNAMTREANKRYREPRPRGIVFAVERLCAISNERAPDMELLDDMIATLQAFVHPYEPDPGSVCLLRFLMGFREG